VPLPQLTTAAHLVSPPLTGDPETGWAIAYIAKGRSPRLRSFSFHATALDAGCSVHPPHSHAGEELVVALSGLVHLNLPTAGGTRTLATGQCAHIGANLPHGLRAPDDAPTTYMIIRWVADLAAAPGGTKLEPGVYDLPRQGAFLDGPTDYLRRLRCSVETLEPGERSETPALPYETALVVLEGTVEAAGAAVAPYGVVVRRAGEPHQVASPGPGVASYLLLELEPHPASAPRKLFETVRWYSRTSPLRR
jgi:mannose-6-phosphate isomerase-like protein (cupin superfamily)